MTRGEALLARLDLEDSLRARLEVGVDESMARHTTLRIGGPADLWVRPLDLAALRELLARTSAAKIPTSFVGSGTNLLVRDGGIRGVVLNLARLNAVTRPDGAQDPGRVEVEAGASTGRLLTAALRWGLGGLEFLAGVPGTVGGGLMMNAGTYLGEFTKVVHEVRSLLADGELRVRDHDACGFRYRASDLPRDEIVVGARLLLFARPLAEMEAEIAALRARRREREPSGVPNAGSTFKNPPGDFAGRLIELAGQKGRRVGALVVSPKHANWLVVDPTSATAPRAADLLALMAEVNDAVERVHGLRLDPELRVLGVD